MPDEKSGKKKVPPFFTGDAGLHVGDCFEEPILVRPGDAPVRVKRRAVLRTRPGTRRF